MHYVFTLPYVGRTQRTTKYGQELTQRESWDSNLRQMSFVDTSRSLPAGILELFNLMIHRDLRQPMVIRLQIWYPVDVVNNVFRLDFEKRVTIPASNGRYQVRCCIKILLPNNDNTMQ